MDGRFTIELPLCEDRNKLDKSKNTALRRFLAVENRFNKNSQLKSNYFDFLREHELLGHMKKLNNANNISNHWECSYYMLRHAIQRDECMSTKTR